MSVRKTQLILIFLIGFILGNILPYYYPNLSLRAYRLNADSQPHLTQPSSTNQPNQPDMRLFWQVYDEVKKDFLFQDKIDKKKMINGAIKGMVAALGDPYTTYLPPKENNESKIELRGKFEGVGIQLGYIDSKLAVIAPLEDTPAFKAGIQAGDFIAAIDDEESLQMSLPDAVDKIRGPKGTKVKLTIIRKGLDKPLDIYIVRGTITINSVELSFIEKNSKVIAHLKLLRFGDLTDSQWQMAVDRILEKQNQNPDKFVGVILDLRNNPGGYLDGAVYVASEFLDRGVVVVEEGLSETRKSLMVNRQGRLINQPLVVLINKGSASASEIVAGALRDRKRAIIVGTTSFGKGTIQEAKDLGNKAGLHVTIAKWLTPNGSWIHNKGLTPQIVVFDKPEAALEMDYSAINQKYIDEAVKVILDYNNNYKKIYEGNFN